MFLEISQNLQESTCARVSFFKKRRLWHRCFPVNFAKISRTPFLQNTSLRLTKTNYAHQNRGSINLANVGATYPPIVGTPPVVVDESNPHCRWPRVSPGIIRYSFTDLGRMEGWVGIAARGDREICWYDLHGESNPGRSHSRTPYNCFYLKPIYFMWVLNYRLMLSVFWVLS